MFLVLNRNTDQLVILSGKLTLAVCAGLSASVALSQEARIDDDRATPIIVTGETQTEEQIRQETRKYVRSINVAHSEKQVARWRTPICPKVIGVDPDIAARVSQTIRQAALEAKAPVAAAKCKSNLLVVFTLGGDQVAQRIAAKRQSSLRHMPMPDRQKILNGDMPVRWWYGIAVKGRDGKDTASDPSSAVQIESQVGLAALPINSDTQITSSYSSSVIRQPFIREISTATVIVDADRAEGKALDAVADYAAMVALAEIDIDAKPDKSVLSVFEIPQKVNGLTDRDKAFLAAVYKIDLDREGRAQRGRITNALMKDAAQN